MTKTILIILTLAGFASAAVKYADKSTVNAKDNKNSAGNQAVSGIPTGAVMFFNLSVCPPGWSVLPEARGRYLVGVQSGGTLAAIVGTPLTNEENRAGRPTQVNTGATYKIDPPCSPGRAIRGECPSGGITKTPAFTIDNSGAVPGTNAPYLQLLVCRKN